MHECMRLLLCIVSSEWITFMYEIMDPRHTWQILYRMSSGCPKKLFMVAILPSSLRFAGEAKQ